MIWEKKSSQVAENLDQLENILLQNRVIEDKTSFFSPPHPQAFTPKDVGIDPQQLEKAVMRINQAIAQQEKVVIFGDYDADGISATAILWQSLKMGGLVATPFIPRRDKHGYGITKNAIDEIAASGAPGLIITVDNGIVALDAIAYAQQLGIDVVLTDHHQPEINSQTGNVSYPSAYAVVHTTQLCGATVSWMLARELHEQSALKSLDLAALATIADQVPLLKANRAFAFHGLVALQQTRRVGLKALTELANINISEMTSSSVGFVLAPRINAMGRLAHGLDALRLLCTGNWQTARTLARLLCDTNSSRQDLTQEQYQIALEQVKFQKEESILFVASDQFHEGVIGLLAGRLVEQFYKPALVVSLNHTGAKGSARSVAGVDVVSVLREVRDDLLEVGGHPMAAGFGLTLDKVDIVKSRLFALTKKSIQKEWLVPRTQLECELPFSLLSLSTCEVLEKFSPFGAGNPEPLFELSNVRVLKTGTVGSSQQHLKLIVADNTDTTQQCDALFWNQGKLKTKIKEGQIISLAAKLECNEWKHRKKLQLIVNDLKTI